jgi:hypothetical protein
VQSSRAAPRRAYLAHGSFRPRLCENALTS